MASKEQPPSPVSPIRDSERVPESPTTARALDFDDEEQKTGTIKMTDSLPSSAAHTTPAQALPAATTEVPPPKPPRPIDPRVQAEATLKEAFPGIDLSVIKAVLAASGGQVEPAFNALLGMSDPDAQQREMPPPQPPRPAARQTQLESDEMYARQLAEHYETTARAQQQQRQPSYGQAPRRQERPLPQAPQRNFIDDDLPEIGENIRKGFVETQTTVNKWVKNFMKKIDGEEPEDDNDASPSRTQQTYQNTQVNRETFGRRSAELRRSADRERYDADPQVLGDDFAGLQLRDKETPPKKPARPPANPDLFKPGNPRKVSFQEGPPQEIGDLYSTPSPTIKPAAASGKTGSKWQPMSQVDPSPVAEHDPFSLGDSDEEKDAKEIKEVKSVGKKGGDDEQSRVESATSDAMSEGIGAGTTKADMT